MPRRRAREPMTDEEAALHAEMVRLKADEARRVKEENTRQLLRKRKEEEEKYSKTNLLKIQNHWRTIMRQTKVLELRKEVEILAQNHEREVDRKDAIISMLMRDLEESEDQYQMAARTHLRNMERFIHLHEERVQVLERDFQSSLAILLGDFNGEREQLMKEHAVEVGELKDIIAAMEDEFLDQMNKIEQEHSSNKEDLRRRNDDDLVVISNELRQKVLKLYSHFRHAMDQYNLHTSDKQIKFRNLKNTDSANAASIDRNADRIRYLQEQRDLIKAKMTTNDREFRERNKALRSEKDAVASHFRKLKARMNRFREDEARRLTSLTIQSNAAITKLEAKLAQAENILKLAEINRKLETEEEKILPFYESTVGDAEVEDVGAATAGGGSGEETEWDYLENFYKRYNKVLLDKTALEDEEIALAEENEQLRAILRRYLEGVSVNADVIDDPNNPLFNTAAAARIPRGAAAAGAYGAAPSQEAAHIVVTQRVAA